MIPIGKVVGSGSAPYNLDENPSFETNLTGITVTNGTISRSSTKAKYGSYSCKAEQTAPFVWLYKRRQDASMQPVIAGKVYSFASVAQMEEGDSAAMRVRIDWYDSEEVLLSSSLGTITAVYDDAWAELTVSAEAPTGATLALSIVQAVAAFSNGEAVYVDGQDFRKASVVSPYVDGDQEGCYWVGTFHASASERSPALALSKGTARTGRTVEGEAKADRPLSSGKAV